MPQKTDALPEAMDLTPVTAQLCFTLYSSSLTMTKAFKPLLNEIGLTYPQYLVLLALGDVGRALTVSALGQQLFLDSGTLTPLLKRMETAGLIIRRRSTADERLVELSLTEVGQDTCRRARAIPVTLGPATGCSARELSELVAALQGVRSALTRHLDAVAGN
ncbi:MarR family winged helix-turn-helix transcriptional regulator [Methyloversatilis sp.]|uniref:MarR family winged helix-turn-helix transcriptional regulator n=1 Tax=Methyloversatilis sp. TaxID=2569862 RepID=UPI0027336388|nr:MarR family transcriptional regulator [Methyloversatilis sp.]MDP3454253.1 MarR family transcriptional regulator [Methyloversatilis sp.]MDP3578141.1 MarR family transcriptional regulator [Methyloversatilis sp.]